MKDIFFKIPLYRKLIIKEGEENYDEKIKSLVEFYQYNGLIDGYNPEINENTTYKVKHEMPNNHYDIHNFLGIRKCTLICVRTNFEITFFFQLTEIEENDEEGNNIETYTFQKVGQIPTIADLEIGKHKKYRKIISKNDLKELNKAIGLASNGIGVGSFVYLRRIFENLIEKYHSIAKKTEINWNEDKYKTARISEKIELLKKYIPDIIVKYRKVYSIVSKGIHELEENECLEYFPIIKDAIITMLEQDYLEKELIENQKKIENNIEKIANKLK